MNKKDRKLTMRVTEDGLLTYAEPAGARCAGATGSVRLRRAFYDQCKKDIARHRPEPRFIRVSMADIAATLDEIDRLREVAQNAEVRHGANGADPA